MKDQHNTVQWLTLALDLDLAQAGEELPRLSSVAQRFGNTLQSRVAMMKKFVQKKRQAYIAELGALPDTHVLS